MEPNEFNTQINRLRDCFGERSYSDERVRLLWREVYQQPQKWLTGAIDFFIGSRPTHQPPLPSDFAQMLRDERERDWQSGKAQRAAEAEQFWTEAPAGFFDRFFKQIPKEEE